MSTNQGLFPPKPAVRRSFGDAAKSYDGNAFLQREIANRLFERLDYIKLARIKGLSPWRVVMVHALRNVMIPIVTVIGLEIGGLVAGSIITETVFAWPGIGQLLIDSINMLDRPVVVAYMMIFTFVFVIINLIVDLIYIALDPRARESLQQ